jgi:hypothetical protein
MVAALEGWNRRFSSYAAWKDVVTIYFLSKVVLHHNECQLS